MAASTMQGSECAREVSEVCHEVTKPGPAKRFIAAHKEGHFLVVEGRFEGIDALETYFSDPDISGLDLSHVDSFSCIGLCQWISLLRKFPQRTWRLHACPSDFVDFAQMYPELLGPGGASCKIVSVRTALSTRL